MDEELNDSDISLDDSVHSGENDELVNLLDVPYTTTESREEDSLEYEILHPNQLSQLMSDITKEVEQIIQIPPTYLRLLLAHFKWDKDALMEFYFEHGKADTFAQTGILDPMDIPVTGSKNLCEKKNEIVCDICFLSTTPSQMFGLSCAHYFCLTCWQRYLKIKIMEESQIDRIYCPSSNCRIIVQDEVVFQMITDQNVRKHFHKLISSSFVLHNRALTWCPGVNCGHAVRCFGPREPYQITCTNCSECFCFACGQPWHDPVRCEQLRTWIKKLENDSGTLGWIAANTKECPKCRATIEKNGGCNHMTCRNVDCKHEFCWMCLDRWEPHGSRWYTCNRYDDSAAKLAREAQASSRLSLDRYLFYSNRYLNHMQSLRFEARLYETVQSKMESMQAHGTSWIDVKFFKKLVEILCRCRRTLMYTYAFAYFLKKNNHSLIFESNQSDLEQSTEQLSEYLDRDLSNINLNELKQKMQDKARYCESRRNVLLDHVHEGYDKGFWEQSDTC
ncbi:unnamed protein product [Schistosoma margrebowiei]|uniref:RBR-type E3 ubiquitin transferase n=1 Tax=Schistosoma margrebowiei TaxID=48269 RepID=A0AA84ZA85_9TREM|nr:unnamed protein product [Schistosoma margrebowiei]